MLELLIWIVPAAVLAAGVWRPRAGLLVLAGSLPLFGSPPGGPYLAALDVAALAAIATAWRAGPAPRSRLDLPVLAFVAVSLASMAPAIYHPPSWRPGPFLGLLQIFPYVESWSALYSWRAAANLIVGALLYLSVRRAFHGRSPRPLGLALAAGLAPTLLAGLASRAGWLALWVWRPVGLSMFDQRLHSLFFHAGWLAEYLVLAVPLAVAALVAGGRRGRWSAVALSATALVVLVLTLQRGAWVAGMAQLGVLLMLVKPGALLRGPTARRRLAALAAAAAVAALALWVVRPGSVEPLLRRVGAMDDLDGRLPVWRAATVMMWDRPALGWGLGAFVPAYQEQRMHHVGGRFAWLTAHSQYLALGAERGAAGLAVFFWLGWVMATDLAAAARARQRELRLLARGLAVALAGAAVYGLVQYLFFIKAIEWLCWILVGIVATLAPPAETGRPGRSARVALLVALAAAAVAGWRWAALEPVASASDRSYGFHAQEGRRGKRFSWTSARAARRLPWRGRRLIVPLANGHPRGDERPVEVVLSVDGRELDRFTLDLPGHWETRCLEVGRPSAESVLLEIEARPPFRPFSDFLRYPELERSRDIRRLGVAAGRPRWQRGPASDPC